MSAVAVERRPARPSALSRSLAFVAVYAFIVGTEQLTGTAV